MNQFDFVVGLVLTKTVVVTGNEGFIGTWLTCLLLRKGFRVIGIDDRSSFGRRLCDDLPLHMKAQVQYKFDVCDKDKLDEVLSQHHPEIVVHLAGQAIVPRAFREPYLTFKTNTLGTLSVLESSKNISTIKAVLAITSDKVYQNLNQVWPYRENDILGGKDIYSASKACAELVCGAYKNSHLGESNLSLQTIRLGNVVGGGDWSRNRLIPDLMNALFEKSCFYVRYPHATRPFQHVIDVVEGIYNIAMAAFDRKIPSGEAWNLGPNGNSVAKVSQILDLFKMHWPELEISQNLNNVPEDINLSVEIAKYRHTFGEPRFDSSQAIQITLDWYKRYFSSGTSAESQRLMEQSFQQFEVVQ